MLKPILFLINTESFFQHRQIMDHPSAIKQLPIPSYTLTSPYYTGQNGQVTQTFISYTIILG